MLATVSLIVRHGLAGGTAGSAEQRIGADAAGGLEQLEQLR